VNLTPRQSDAVEAKGSVAVTAGAGTGKTAMLAARFVHHVAVDGFSPLEIAAVTFTEKAAAELRARIRTEIAAEVGDDRAAEVDTGQISTIHSLAARICRDFYDLAEIPADFRLLDETDSQILQGEWFDEAMAAIPAHAVNELGYTWLRSALQEVYKDPPAAKSALSYDAAATESLVKDRCKKALADLMSSECWAIAEDILHRYPCDAVDDKLHAARVNVINAMSDIAGGRSVTAAFNSAFTGFRSNGGTAKNWPAGLAEVRDCLKDLRDGFRACQPMATLEFGDSDAEMCRRVGLLREAFNSVFEFIQSAKRDRRVLDFADLEHYALKVLEHAEARAHYARRWKALLVDEFQDTNPVQERLIRLLAENGARLTIVGDGKQSIYGFRRADPRVFERFRQSIKNDVVLDRTFRTHKSLVSPLNTIFEHLLSNAHQPLEAERTEQPHDGPFVWAHSFNDDDSGLDDLRHEEAKFIAGEIGRIIAAELPVWDKAIGGHRPIQPSDIAIISRTRAPLEIYIDELIHAGIPAVNAGGGYLLDTRVAKDVSALLRFCADQADDIALVALLRGPFFAVDDVTLYNLSTQKGKDETWWQLVSREHSTIERPYQILTSLLAVARRDTAERLVETADDLTGYTAVVANLKQGERRIADWFGFVALIRKFARLGRSDVVGADRYLKDLHRAGASIPRPPLDAGNAVSLMTIHAAKGLEWPVVFVPNLSAVKRSNSATVRFDAEIGVGFKFIRRLADGKYAKEEPALYKILKDKQSADDRLEAGRILYVAMTRARDRLYLTSAGKDGTDFAALMPGFDAAGVDIVRHDAAFPPRPRATTAPAENKPIEFHDQLSSISPLFDSISVTGLAEYTACPKRFKFRHVDGHPGASDGASTDARVIGTLTHLALEMGFETPDQFDPFASGESDEVLNEAIRLARVFREGSDFSSFQLGRFRREEPVSLLLNGITLSGIADLVGDDWVLDYKTDSEPLADEHAVQLWAYATALNKKRALIAYLRQEKLHEYTAEDLSVAAGLANAGIRGIAAGEFTGRPTKTACGRCSYSSICD
jgi:ATP-dependent helicase/nuclease subunit A